MQFPINVKQKALPQTDLDNYNQDLAYLQVGSGEKVIRSDQSGLWAGGGKFAQAPFRVNMQGGVVASDAKFVGTVQGSSGYIGGWIIGKTSLVAANRSVGINSQVSGNTDWRFWAGSSVPASAPFRVDESGNLVAESATISGAIIAATIDIGGADATSFHVDIDGNIWSGHANFASAPFTVSNAGVLTATGVDISGEITATSGEIGGWTIETDTLESVDDDIVLDPVNKKITVADGDDKIELLVDSGHGFIDFYYGASLRARLRGTTVGTGLRVVDGDLVIENEKSLLLENGAGSDWGSIGLNASDQLIMELPSGNQFFLTNSGGTTNLFTVSDKRTYCERLKLKQLASDPGNNEVGDVVYADGVSWDPGNGVGIYVYINTGAGAKWHSFDITST